MKKTKDAEIVNESANRQGWFRNLILGDGDDRGALVKRIFLWLVVGFFLWSVIRGVIKTGGEPLGDLKIEKSYTVVVSPYKASRYIEHSAKTIKKNR